MLYRFRWFVIAFSMVLAPAPFSGIVAAACLAAAFGCTINDAATTTCLALGSDWGPALADLAVTISLGEIVFPVLAILLIGWAAIEGIVFAFGRRSRIAR